MSTPESRTGAAPPPGGNGSQIPVVDLNNNTSSYPDAYGAPRILPSQNSVVKPPGQAAAPSPTTGETVTSPRQVPQIPPPQQPQLGQIIIPIGSGTAAVAPAVNYVLPTPPPPSNIGNEPPTQPAPVGPLGTGTQASTPVILTRPNQNMILTPPSPTINTKNLPVLCINPNKAAFTTAGGVSKHLMINKSVDRLAIKIRSSNNFFFRVNPVYSFLDCQSVNELEVIRLPGGGAKQDKLQLIYVICSDSDTDATKLFGLRAKVRSVILPITTTV